MSRVIQVSVNNPVLRNKIYQYKVLVELQKYWSEIILHQYLYVQVKVMIPVLENELTKTIAVVIYKEFVVSEIDSDIKQVELPGEFSQTYDVSRRLEATASILYYEKLEM